MDKFIFVLVACKLHRATTVSEKGYWESQYHRYQLGGRGPEMSDFTLAAMSDQNFDQNYSQFLR